MVPEYRESFIRFATTCAEWHNTQPWKFKIQDNQISNITDMTRAPKVVDPDDHQHLNVVLAAQQKICVLQQRQRTDDPV